MKTLPLMGSIAALAAIGLADPLIADPLYAHGGTYRGPGDTVPPGGGRRGPGLVSPPPAGPSGPVTPPAGTPNTPIPTTPGQTPGTPTPTTPTSPQNVDLGADLSQWDFWWGFNKEPYLNLRRKVRSSGVVSGSDEEILGFGHEGRAIDSLRPGEALIRERVVPALTHALATERQNDIVTGCLIALAKIGDVRNEDGTSAFVQLITRFLASPEQEISETAALALGILGDDRSVPALVGLMHGDELGRSLIGTASRVPYRTQSFAAYGLGLVGYRTETEDMRRTISGELLRFLEDDVQARPDQQVGALQALGLVPLAWEGADVDTLDRLDVLEQLIARLNPDAHRGGFRDFRVRAQVPIAMARLLATHEQSVPDGPAVEMRTRCIDALLATVAKNTKEKRVEVRQSAAIALGMIGNAAEGGASAATKDNRRIFEALKRVSAQDAVNQTRFFALMALAQLGSRPGPGDDPRGLQEDVRNLLLSAVAKGKRQQRPWAALGLGVFGNALHENNGVLNPSVPLALRDVARTSKSPVDSGAYAIALGLLGDNASSDMLIEKLDRIGTGQDEVRGNLCVALGLMGANGAREILASTVQQSKFRPSVMKQAAVGLGLLGDKSAIAQLLDMLEGAKGLSSQAAIATALGTIGDVSAVDGLVRMLAGETEKKMTDTARGFAAVALGITCDKEDFPWNTKLSVNANYRANVSTLTDVGRGDGILDIK